MDAQTNQQSRRHPNQGGNPNWVRGKSANPSGKTRTQIRTAEFMDLFRQTHGRAPNVIEATQVKAAGAMAARCEANNTSAQDQVRCANVLSRLLASLKLDRAPVDAGDAAFPDHGLRGGT
jgi:hypothetical protein